MARRSPLTVMDDARDRLWQDETARRTTACLEAAYLGRDESLTEPFPAEYDAAALGEAAAYALATCFPNATLREDFFNGLKDRCEKHQLEMDVQTPEDISEREEI
mgnify:FL=1